MIWSQTTGRNGKVVDAGTLVKVEGARQEKISTRKQRHPLILASSDRSSCLISWCKYLPPRWERQNDNYSKRFIKQVYLDGKCLINYTTTNYKHSENEHPNHIDKSPPIAIQDPKRSNPSLKKRQGDMRFDNKNGSITNNYSTVIRGNTTAKQHQNIKNLSVLVLLLTTILTCAHHAPSCSGFTFSQYDHNSDLTGYNYPQQSQFSYFGPQSSYLTPNNHQHSHYTRLQRSYNDDPILMGSFSQDPSSTIAPPGQAQASWTSIFGFGQRPQPSPAPSGGGGDDFDNHIKKILVPRVSGTPGNVQVRNYIVNELRRNDYDVQLDKFTGSTPVGNVEFANIIATSNPNACRQLVLACHYDSKMMDGFLGAIDSAVPCAMLLKISDKFSDSFRPNSSDTSSSSSSNLGLTFIFFDGEEAYVQWTHSDSLYGSRHLAAKWAKQAPPEQCGLDKGKSELDRIELFVLLDLIGTSDTSFVMYNSLLKHHYEALQKYEKAFLIKSGLNQLQARRAAAFKSRNMPLDFVEDDHVPFRKRGVPILLLLAHPFPKVWHTVADNYEAIDFPKTRRILHVMEEFVANYPSSGGGNS